MAAATMRSYFKRKHKSDIGRCRRRFRSSQGPAFQVPPNRGEAKRKRFHRLSLSFPNGKKVHRPAPDGCGRVAALTGC